VLGGRGILSTWEGYTTVFGWNSSWNVVLKQTISMRQAHHEIMKICCVCMTAEVYKADRLEQRVKRLLKYKSYVTSSVPLLYSLWDQEVGKSNPKGWNGIILTESVVFRDCGNLPLFASGEIPQINVDFYGEICNKNFWKNSNLKHHKISKLLMSPLLSREKSHHLTYIFLAKIIIVNYNLNWHYWHWLMMQRHWAG